MKLLTVDTIEEARNKINSFVKSWPVRTQTIPSQDAAGRVLAGDIFSPCDIPAFNRSVVDGYAVLAADTSGAGEAIPVFLKLKDSVEMGKPAGLSIKSGECAYVPTGGMLPDNADAVVMIEYAEKIGSGTGDTVAGDIIALYESVAPGFGMVLTGEDLHKGNILLQRRTFLRPQEIGALAAAGVITVPVLIPLNLCLISTGDELVPPEQEPAPGEIRDINTGALRALAIKHGYNVVSVQVLPDDEARLEKAVRDAMPVCDVIIISGGSSQGEKDFTAKIIDNVADPGVFTHGLALKPGKPTILGWDEKSKTLFAGLPGHPVSAMMVFELLLSSLPGGYSRQSSRPVPARISCNIPGAPGKTVCQPVVLTLRDNSYIAEPVFGKSGMITTLTRADGYIIIDLNKEGLKKDEPVLVHLF